MKNLDKHLMGVATVAVGVVLAGYLLNTFRTNALIADARAGFVS